MTIPDVAVILGAGWKPFNECMSKDPDIVPRRVPELLWPLGDGHTVLSRLTAQLKAKGITRIIAAVGHPDDSPKAVEDRHAKQYGWAKEGYGEPVWTAERLDYIHSMGACPFLIRNPFAAGKTCWSTLVDVAGDLLADGSWEHVFTCSGDYIFKTEFLRQMIDGAVYSSQIWLWPKHSIEFLDRRGLRAFLDYLAELNTYHQGKVYLQRGRLCERGVRIIDMPCPPKSQPNERRAAWSKLMVGWFEIGPNVHKMQNFVTCNPIAMKGETGE